MNDRTLPWTRLLPHLLVPSRRTVPSHRHLPRVCILGRCLWGQHRLRGGTHEQSGGIGRMEVALYPRGNPILSVLHHYTSRTTRLSRIGQVVERRRKGIGIQEVGIVWIKRERQGNDVGGYKKDADRVASVCSLFGEQRRQGWCKV